MKKGGWDCMRHYEIAAAGAVNAFYRLSEKPKSCAPHGLIDMVNAIGFDSAEELEHKVEVIHKARTYDQMRSSSLLWVREHACESVAYKLLATELGWQPNSSGH
jgi:hypothetical protein